MKNAKQLIGLNACAEAPENLETVIGERLPAYQLDDGSGDEIKRLAKERDEARAEVDRLEEELESHAWDITPAMAQARIDQLTAEVERLRDEHPHERVVHKKYHEECIARLTAEVERLQLQSAFLRGPVCECGHQPARHETPGCECSQCDCARYRAALEAQ